MYIDYDLTKLSFVNCMLCAIGFCIAWIVHSQDELTILSIGERERRDTS